jgi:regulator of sigma E protease
LSLIQTLGAFLLALGILIVVHEFGHYLAARACGVDVLRFSLGFGKPLICKQFAPGGTEWVIAAFPLGGYVKMLDEREGIVPPERLDAAFNRKNVWARIVVVAAGPAANFLLAIGLYWMIYVGGAPDAKPLLSAPQAATPAASTGISRGDLLIHINGKSVSGWQEARWQLLRLGLAKEDVQLDLRRPDGSTYVAHLDLSGFDIEGTEGDPVQRIGIRLIRPDAVVGRIVAGGAADRGGLKVGDRVLSVDNQPVSGWDELVSAIRRNPEKRIQLRISNNAGQSNLELTPDAYTDNGRTIGRIGVEPQWNTAELQDLRAIISYDPVRSFEMALTRTWETSVFSLKMIGKMITGDVSLKNISGPVTIADYAGQSAQAGWVPYLAFLAMVSISLGVLNLLPIPLLDGGHLMYYLAEIALRRPLAERAVEMGQRLGLAVLVLLMAFALYNDINRLISG